MCCHELCVAVVDHSPDSSNSPRVEHLSTLKALTFLLTRHHHLRWPVMALSFHYMVLRIILEHLGIVSAIRG